jgi:anti-sigma factor ChrR (cupin superfamily)
MEINADFNQPALVHAADLPWVPSPMPGVERRMLDRIGDEVARATSIVRYAPGSAFSAHVHGGGEEFIVLSGVFSDEHGDYPAGSYVRNPPTSAHTPASATGCTLFVKLWQFAPDDRTHYHLKLQDPMQPCGNGYAEQLLYADKHEQVRYVELTPGAQIKEKASGGIELFVLSGGMTTPTLNRWSWLRLPPGQTFAGQAGAAGARIWIKTGHLRKPPRVPQASA